MKQLLLGLLLLICLNCQNHSSNSNTRKRKVGPQKAKVESPKKIGDFMAHERSSFVWTAEQTPEEGSSYPKIVFYDEYARIQFHGQCYYWFFTHHYYTGTDKIELVWTFKKDFVYDIESLSQSNGVKKFPHYDDVFSEYSLVNDSVIKVKYHFPEWVKKVNELEKYTVFPDYFYLENIDIK